MTQTPVARLNPCFFRQGWKYNKERGVRIFVVFRFFWGGELVFVTFFLGMAGLLYHSWAHLGKWPATELTFAVNPPPRPQCPRLAVPGRPEHPSGGGALSSMRLVANDYMRRCLWCQWHEAHWYGGSNPPRSALIPFGAQKRATPTLTNIENMAIWLPGVTLARAWRCPWTAWGRLQ